MWVTVSIALVRKFHTLPGASSCNTAISNEESSQRETQLFTCMIMLIQAIVFSIAKWAGDGIYLRSHCKCCTTAMDWYPLTVQLFRSLVQHVHRECIHVNGLLTLATMHTLGIKSACIPKQWHACMRVLHTFAPVHYRSPSKNHCMRLCRENTLAMFYLLYNQSSQKHAQQWFGSYKHQLPIFVYLYLYTRTMKASVYNAVFALLQCRLYCNRRTLTSFANETCKPRVTNTSIRDAFSSVTAMSSDCTN